MLDHSHVSGRRETTTATVGRDPGYEARPGGAVAVATLGPNEWSISGRCSPAASCGPGVAVAVGHRASPRGSYRSWATTAAANVPTAPSSSSPAARALAP